ncbi:hypothetical protein PHYBLDRAFT_157329 [Phycomyces blakesleeanus NRRL 1555(-)]|uniref:Uncharacterized protein n=2 Tax=Phycomyces blakesleeanus TaxID=4837 RepID=A0A162V3T9_PHYB8|nr:hypothetical protein PHYBLDRAFT_157329 [Phycomyces blakesleeanus NRRL 1555(-)]OAD79762.1 hypothetical protein PHYBLDRAFT_157329 [Phycomyces blakesleeanus NRRL 1555(-)]|eukprot:XP_018297802.1 hypothetical protein PHYBLDRAFT_157329 [Phycomyces blakesleeanus NRRL 1555(-)]
MTAMGRRFYNFECHEDICTEIDRKLFDKMRNIYKFPMIPSEEEIQGCLAWENGVLVRDCYRARLKERHIYREDDEARLVEGISSYLKDTPRKVNVARLMPFLERTLREMSEFEHENADYRMICDAKKCCGDACEWALETVVYGSQLEGRMKAWPDKIGEPQGNWIE